MQSDINKKIKRIFFELNNIGKNAKIIIKYGSQAAMALFALGTVLVVLNHSAQNFDPYKEFLAVSIVKSSFTLLAEAIVGGILVDFFLKKS